jgi:hypothetical protein
MLSKSVLLFLSLLKKYLQQSAVKRWRLPNSISLRIGAGHLRPEPRMIRVDTAELSSWPTGYKIAAKQAEALWCKLVLCVTAGLDDNAAVVE